MNPGTVGQQEQLFKRLIANAGATRFGLDHGLSSLRGNFDYALYTAKVPLRTYEDYGPYWDALARGERDVLHPGFPDFFAISSGTTGGPKKIPLTRDQIRAGIRRTTQAFMRFLWAEKTLQPLTQKFFYLSAPAILSRHADRPMALLSVLSHHQLRGWPLKSRALPTWNVNSDPDPASRKKRIVEELLSQRISYFSGTPPWMLAMLDECARVSGRPLPDVFPDLRCLGSGGTAMSAYRAEFESRFPGRKLIFFESFTASEGVVGSRDRSNAPDYVLDSGMLAFEFVPFVGGEVLSSRRCLLKDVTIGQDYAIAVSNPSGLLSYLLGDVIQFTSLDPVRFEVRGRTENFLNRYGEHLLASELERVVQTLRSQNGSHGDLRITEFTVFNDAPGYVLCVEGPGALDLEQVVGLFDRELCAGNPLLRNARRGGVAGPWKIVQVPEGFLPQFFLNQGRVAGQSKIPRIVTRRIESESLAKAVAGFESRIGGKSVE